MDNISGSAAWTVQDTKKKKKNEYVDAPKAEFITPDPTSLFQFIEQARQAYHKSPNKPWGDVIVHLDSADKLIKRLWEKAN